jgi:trehalose synthase
LGARRKQQPAAVRYFSSDGNTKWVWRCHVDSSEPDAQVWSSLKPYLDGYDAAVFTMEKSVPPGFGGPGLFFIQPAIDPLSPKNRALPRYLCREEVGEFGIDLSRPLLIQVSRFDRW